MSQSNITDQVKQELKVQIQRESEFPFPATGVRVPRTEQETFSRYGKQGGEAHWRATVMLVL
ncbi:hypothetical protein ACQEWB_09375 [Streptomyces sp. CA-249302]|uniref:hypothetical protein n=1 Tax=Streptomyces sp. CA-249302 TaxID=3240058 RepID=UPI003D8A841F